MWGASDLRGQLDIREVRNTGAWFIFEDVGCYAQALLHDCSSERMGVYDFAASAVHEDGTILHGVKECGIYKVVRLRLCGNMQTDSIRLCSDFDGCCAALNTERHCAIDRTSLSDLRKQVEKKVVTDYLRPLQAPPGVSPVLKCWMELNEG